MPGEDKMQYLFLLYFFFFMSACSFLGTAYNISSKVGAVFLDERSLEDDWKDTQINIQIRSSLMSIKPTYALDIEVTVFEGEVMLNGALPTVEDIQTVVETAWQPDDVSKVYNHIRIQNPSDIMATSDDALIASSIRSQLLLTQNISSVNYKITVDEGTLYVMGIAKNQQEHDAVMNIIYATNGIEKVISHVRKSYEQ